MERGPQDPAGEWAGHTGVSQHAGQSPQGLQPVDQALDQPHSGLRASRPPCLTRAQRRPGHACAWRPGARCRPTAKAQGGQGQGQGKGGQSLEQPACSRWGTHRGPGVRSGVRLAHCPRGGEQLLQFLHVHAFLLPGGLVPISQSGPGQCQDTRVPLAPGALRGGQLVFYILTQEDPEG